MQTDVASGLAAVRLEMESASRALELASPEALAGCEAALGRAAAVLRQGHREWDWKSAGVAARAEAERLPSVARRAGRLVSSACRYHEGWRRILFSMAGGYSARGEAVSLTAPRRISLEA